MEAFGGPLSTVNKRGELKCPCICAYHGAYVEEINQQIAAMAR